jgi:AraC-like DNA-binding protein
MVLVFDTANVAVVDRAAALESVLVKPDLLPVSLDFVDGPPDVHNVIHSWALGPSVNLRRHTGRGLRLVRTAKHVRVAAPETISLSLHTGGPWRVSQHGFEQCAGVRPELTLTDFTAPFESVGASQGELLTLTIEVAFLGLPVDVIRQAASRIASSPVNQLVVRHMQELAQVADGLERVQADNAIGSATTELTRALIASAAGPDRLRRQTWAESLRTRIALYVVTHLADAELNASEIAAAHAISIRQLYNVWGNEPSLARWIRTARLERARTLLSRNTSVPVAVVARQCGFANASHFSQQFRESYGVPPQVWRRARSATTPRW